MIIGGICMSEAMNDIKGNPQLLAEYEEVFTNEEKVSNALNISKSNFATQVGYVDFDDLSFTEPIKKSRRETYLGLTTSIGELGILTPIHVMVTEGYADYLDGDKEEEEFEGFKYIVIDGFRRVFAGKKNGINGCNAVIWEFKDKDLGSQLITPLSRLLNRAQQHSWSEIWYLYQILEMQSAMSPGTLEYLLQLEPGDAMKLKDIMSCSYQEVIDELMSNKKTLSQCYNMLQKLRKEEDTLMLEDQMGLSEVEEAKEIVDDSDRAILSDEDVKEILEMSDSFDGELSEDDFDELMGNNIPDDRQTSGDRHPLDPALRAAVLQRDGYCCQITGRGKGLPTPIALSILNVHHKIPVHCGGTDTMDNLITVCLDAHTLIHVIERNLGKLGMSKEQFDELDEEEKTFIKGVMKIARIAVEANKRMGKSKEQIKKETSDSIRFKMPGTDLKENMDAIKSVSK